MSTPTIDITKCVNDKGITNEHGPAMPYQRYKAKNLCANCFCNLIDMGACPICRGTGIENLDQHMLACNGKTPKAAVSKQVTTPSSYTDRKRSRKKAAKK